MTPLELAQRVAAKLRQRGAKGLIGINRSFRIIDRDNSGSLSHAEFAKALCNYRIAENDSELSAIFEIFDRDNSGSISYNEFLRTIIGEMNPFRRQLAIQAYQKLDTNSDG